MKRLMITYILILSLFTCLGDPSYNCHGYVWEGGGWLNSPPLQSAKQDPSGPIVVYFRNDKPIHSGWYLGYGMVKSKWGRNPVVIHPLWLSTYGFDWRFYSKIKLTPS